MMKANVIEKNFKETLNVIATMNLSAKEVKADTVLYNELAIKAMEYFGKVALLSNRNRIAIKSTGIEFDEFLDDVVMHFLDHLDAVIACDESGRIPFIINMTNNKVIDKVRAWNRIYGTNKKDSKDNSDNTENEEKEATVGFLDELAWRFITDNTDIAQNYENYEMACLIVNTLANKAKAFDAVTFMAINILGWKTGKLADKLIEQGYKPVLFEILTTVMNIFDIKMETFSKIISDSNNNNYTFDMTNKKLAADLSRKSYTAKDAVKKVLRKEF